VCAQDGLDVRRQEGAQPVGRLEERSVGRGGVGQHHRAQARRAGQRVLLGQEPAPALAEDVVLGDAQLHEQVRQLVEEQLHGPELAVPGLVAQMRAAAVAELVVQDHRPSTRREPGHGQQVVVGGSRATVQQDDRRYAAGQVALDAEPRPVLAEGDRAGAGHASSNHSVMRR